MVAQSLVHAISTQAMLIELDPGSGPGGFTRQVQFDGVRFKLDDEIVEGRHSLPEFSGAVYGLGRGHCGTAAVPHAARTELVPLNEDDEATCVAWRDAQIARDPDTIPQLVNACDRDDVLLELRPYPYPLPEVGVMYLLGGRELVRITALDGLMVTVARGIHPSYPAQPHDQPRGLWRWPYDI